jgi:hypothetical protein
LVTIAWTPPPERPAEMSFQTAGPPPTPPPVNVTKILPPLVPT